jgi:predicted transcriptional regulator
MMQTKDWDWTEYRRNENYLDDYRAKKEQKLLEIIRLYTVKEGGISQKKLLKEMNLDRKNVMPSIDNLIRKGLVKKQGYHAKYISTEKSYDDPMLYAYFFADLFRRDVLKKDILVTTRRRVENTLVSPAYCTDFTIYRHYFEPKFTEKDKLEHALFEFSNKIGAFVTYVLIQAMDPDTYSNNLKSAQEQDRFVMEWVHKAVLRALPFIIWQFRDSIHKGINQYPRNYHEHVRYMDQAPKFIISREINDRLTGSFARIYPLITFEFQRIFQNLSSEIDGYKLQIEELKQKRKEQEKCEHQFGKPVISIYGLYARQCVKCNHFKKVKESVYKVVSDLEAALNDFWKIEEVKPVDFRCRTRLHNMTISLSSQIGEQKTIRALQEEQAYALRDFIMGRQKRPRQ